MTWSRTEPSCNIKGIFPTFTSSSRNPYPTKIERQPIVGCPAIYCFQIMPFRLLYAFTVFASSIVTVIGPTPPGTGVI